MTFPRALAWMRLLPRDVTYVCDEGPAWLQDAVAANNPHGARRVLVAWRPCEKELPDLHKYYGVAVLNGRNVREDSFRRSGFGHVRHFASVPHWRQVRWFVPLGHPAASAAAFQLQAPVRPTARLKSWVLQTAARCRSPFWYRDHLLLALRESTPLERMLQDLFGSEPCELALSTSNARSELNRKLLLAVLDRRGQCFGFGKLALSPASAPRVRHEAEVLRAIAAWPNPITAPQLLFDGCVDDTRCTIASPVAGRVPGVRLTSAHRRFLASLQNCSRQPVAQMSLVRALHRRAQSIAGAEDFVRWLDRLEPTLQSLVLPSGIVHRDFAPWNLRRRQGEIAAFDWETAELEGPPLLDEFHHVLAVAYFLEQATPEKAADRLLRIAAAHPLGLAIPQVLSLQLLYLIDHLVGLLEDGYGVGYPKFLWWWAVFSKVARSLNHGSLAPPCGKNPDTVASALTGEVAS